MNNRIKVNLKIAHLNIQSISNKLDLLKDFLVKNEIDIMCLNETFLTKKKLIKIQNYKIIRRDRDGRGGGVAILIHESINFSKVDLCASSEEYVAVSIKVDSVLCDLLLVSYYNPPLIKINKKFLNSIFNTSQNVLLIGDLNAHHQLWRGCRNDAAGKVVFNQIMEKDLVVLNDESHTYNPIHRVSKSIIDLAISTISVADRITDFKVSDELHSDHLSVILNLKYSGPFIGAHSFSSKDSQVIRTFDFNKFDEDLLRLTSLYSYTTPNSVQKVDSMTDDITKLLQLAIKNSSSSKIIKVSKNKLLILPREILLLVKKKRKIRRQIQRNNSPELKSQFYRLDRQIKTDITEFKRNKWQNFCTSLNSTHVSDTKFWRGIKSVDNDENHTPKSHKLLHNGNLVEDPIYVNELFAENLEKIFTNNVSDKYDACFKDNVDQVANSVFNDSFSEIGDNQKINLYDLKLIIKKIKVRVHLAQTEYQIKSSKGCQTQYLGCLLTSSMRLSCLITYHLVGKMQMSQ